jgi:hypothetical protein
MADEERASMLDRKINRVVEAALDVLNRLTDLADSEAALIGKFEPGQASPKEFHTPGVLERFHLSTDIGMAGM